MQFASSKLPLVLAAAMLLSAGSLQAQTTADVPTALSGTYDLTLDSTNGSFANFPHKKGDVVRFVIDGTKDTLCINGTLLSTKATINSVGNAYTWSSNTNTFYEVVVVNNALHEINSMQGSTSNFAGQFVGTRSSSSTDCTSATTTTTPVTPTISSDVQSIFDLAASVYPSLLVNGSALGSYQGYVYKFFAASGIYVGIKDNKIFTMGGPFGSGIKEQGSVSVVLNALQTAKARIDAIKPTTPTTPTTPVTPTIPVGLYKLTVSGTYKTSGIVSINVPISITLNDLPAPSVTDTDVFVDQVKTSFGFSGVSNVKVTSINNTASRVTFRVEFSATLTGVGNVGIDLTYDYTK